MSAIKRIVRTAGTVLSLGCFGWIAWRFYSSGILKRLEESGHASVLAERIGRAAPIYGAGVVLLGVAWWLLQCAFAPRVSAERTITGYATTQLGKYLPGNIAQYVGRHVMLRKLGLQHSSLVLCALGEALLLVCAAIEWGSPLLLRGGPRWAPIAVFLSVPCVLFFLAAIAKTVQKRNWFVRYVPVLHASYLIGSFVIYLCFFALMAITLVVVASATPTLNLHFLALAAAAAISWIAGYAVLGAPAGLGVREVVFISLLKGMTPDQDILVLVAGFRAATFCGDVLAFLAALSVGTVRKSMQERSDAEVS